MSISRVLKNFCAEERGATAVEYALILALIVLAMLGSLSGFANAATAMWTDVEQKSADAIEKAAG
jgi:pilus assembly protein Flp/PilA